MPWIVAVLVGLLARSFESLVARMIIAIGIGVVTATGVDAALGALRSQSLTMLTGVPGAWAGLLGLAKVDVCVSMLMGAVISAYGVRLVGGALSRFTAKVA